MGRTVPKALTCDHNNAPDLPINPPTTVLCMAQTHLHVHAKVDEVGQHLRVPLRLHVATHHTEAQPRLTVLHDKPRDNGVKRSLGGCVHLGNKKEKCTMHV